MKTLFKFLAIVIAISIVSSCQKEETILLDPLQENSILQPMLKTGGDYIAFLQNLNSRVEAVGLNTGNKNALISKIEAAIKSLKKGNTSAAKGQLNAFINQVEAFIQSGILNVDQGEDLNEDAKQAIKGDFFLCGQPFTDPRDGQTYETVLMGDLCWMADNLAYLPEVSPSSEESDNDPFYYVYDYEGTNVTSAKATFSYGTYGVLYNFSAALSACPAGWHLSSDPEWTELTEYLTNNGYGYEGSGDDIAKSLASTSGWRSLDNPGVVGYDQASNNSSGFSAPPSGYRHFDGYPHGLTRVAFFWTSSEDRWLSGHFLFRGLHYYTGVVYRSKTNWSFGFSVRCVKD